MSSYFKNQKKLVLVTGGSKGLGLEICKQLLNAGYQVSACARKETDEVRELAGGFYDFQFEEVDISGDEVKDWILLHSGNVWGLVNNAAVAQDGVLATLPEAEIDKMLEINLSAPIKLTRHVIRKMLRQNPSHGRIINISSITGSRGYNGLATYSATKAGLDGFTRAMARELGPVGITVNSIAPGFMETELSSGLGPKGLDQILRRTPTGRLVTTQEVAAQVVNLLAEESGSITGQTIIIDGGITV